MLRSSHLAALMIFVISGASAATGSQGWPFPTGGPIFSSPALADINGDGQVEIVFATRHPDGTVYCTDLAGNELWHAETGGSNINSSAALADLDDDPSTLEIVIGSGMGSLGGHLHVFSSTGIELAAFETSSAIHGSPLIIDLEGDGLLEIIFGQTRYYGSSKDSYLFCVNLVSDDAGKWVLQERWSVNLQSSVLGKPAAADFDGDGVKELVCASSGTINSSAGGRRIYSFDSNGNQLWFFDTLSFNNYDSPTIADLDADGRFEVVQCSNDGNVYCLDALTGELNWVFDASGSIMHSQAVADLQNNDGFLEVIVGASGGNELYCLDHNGNLLWSYSFLSRLGFSSPAVGDLDGDGDLEVIVGTDDYNHPAHLYAFDHLGNLIWAHEMPDTIYSSPSLADLDGDGLLEIAVGCYDNNFYVLDSEGNLYVPPRDPQPRDLNPWSQFRRDERNTGYYPGCHMIPSDLDCDGDVDAADLAILLGSWGSCEGCTADLDGDGVVGPADLMILLGSWG